MKGVGLPGMMFVLSAERSFNLAWYMLNQVTLDKGPAIGYPNNKCAYGNSNCWASGNSGEIDFLESAWTVDAGATDNYRRLYSTQWNQVRRSFIGDQGETCNADGGWFSNQETSNNYFLGASYNQSYPYVFVAVVERIGTFIYQIPASTIDSVWPGLSRKTLLDQHSVLQTVVLLVTIKIPTVPCFCPTVRQLVGEVQPVDIKKVPIKAAK